MSLSSAEGVMSRSIGMESSIGLGSDIERMPSVKSKSIVIIDNRALDRECLAEGMRTYDSGMNVVDVGSIAEWKAVRERHPTLAVILINLGGRRMTDPAVGEELRKLTSEFSAIPVVVLADTEDLVQIFKALEYGAKGYIPSSVGIKVCIEAIHLALAGGTFLPASSVMAVRQLLERGGDAARQMTGMFTTRQAEVVEALRRGKANKIIAYELNLRESTVKVHIRNIMRKLKATNRTEVACKINDLFPIAFQSSMNRQEVEHRA